MEPFAKILERIADENKPYRLNVMMTTSAMLIGHAMGCEKLAEQLTRSIVDKRARRKNRHAECRIKALRLCAMRLYEIASRIRPAEPEYKVYKGG